MSKINIDEVKKIIELFESFNINKFKIKNNKFELEVDKNSVQNVSYSVPNQQQVEISNNSTASETKIEPADEKDVKIIESPIPGTFYRAPSPEDDPFVNVGDDIKVGDVLGIVEAMKVMNKIESEVSGKVTEILCEDSEPVEYGTKLLKIKLS
ncbi:MAG: acetyl-CoA carboxylase biotin carboxyl carrier protein [Candidatus Marinimicrobia bacterium]|nr:acetyl-CoA carboxylase biotin carboxyl carrier protein [Candidatus Neomarinimicrobiota bacterium]